jgi:undecaprenol kinase
MKNQGIFRRFQFAWAGLKATVRSERSFRTHIGAFAFVVCLLLFTRPPAIWWALMLLTCGLMMAIELINTAVEKLVDHIHPDQHEIIGVVKDTLAGAVLLACAGAVCVLLAFLAR